MEEGLFHNPVFVQHISEFAVAAIGHSNGHQEVEAVDPRTGQKRQVCPIYGSIPCSAHQATSSQARGNFEFKGVPASFAADAQGKLVSKIEGRSPQAVIDALNEAQMKIGKPPLRGSQIAKLERDLFKGDAQLAKGKFEKAKKEYEGVANDEAIPEFIRKRGRDRLEKLNQAALAAVEAARAEGGSKAKRELKKLLRDLDGIDDAKAACEEALAEGE